MPKKSKSVKAIHKRSISRGCFRKYAMGASHMVADDQKASEIYAAGVVGKQEYGYNDHPNKSRERVSITISAKR